MNTNAQKKEHWNIDISERYMEEQKANDKRRWVFIDLEEHDFQIRQEELRKYMKLRARERRNRAWKKEAQSDLFKLSLIPRLCGILMIFMSIFTWILASKVFGEVDGTYLLFTIPVGIVAMIAPGYNKPKR